MALADRDFVIPMNMLEFLPNTRGYVAAKIQEIMTKVRCPDPIAKGQNRRDLSRNIPLDSVEVFRSIYSKFTKDYGVILCLYVDDILIVETNMESINETKKFLSSCFQMKDMNEVDTILRIKVKRYSGVYSLNQCHYIDKIINKFQHLNIEEANTPYESSCKLVENNGIVVAQIEYASAIGYLMYATHCTRPDIAYAACKLSRYTSNLSQDHWKAIGRVFGYLKRTRQLALYYDCFPAVLKGYSNASWITRSSDSKSITGWIFTLGGGAICWGSKKQTCITHFTMEAEFLALAAAGKEKEWLRNMLLDI
uniref:Zinc finger, CCHC-type n=1 Tax=Tanacetum cinerariifolium TaxID=118510 RepID=A0A6L2KWS3_TANCI|nr:zinc finger, CCHC-type [Tanacetum cinerariifolium]